MIPAFDPSCNKRARRGETGSDLGRIEEDRRSHGWSLRQAKLKQRSLPARRRPRALFPARLLQLRLTLRQLGRLPRRGLPCFLLPLPKMSQQGMTPLPTHPPTRLAKKIRARLRRKQRKRPQCTRGHWNLWSQLPEPLPAPGSCRACRLWCLQLGQGLARLLVPCSLGWPPTLAKLPKDSSSLG
jgi:hypothetical protein